MGFYNENVLKGLVKEPLETMPPRRNLRSQTSRCCCATHRYLCPVHSESTDESLIDVIVCIWQKHKRGIIIFLVTVGILLFASIFFKQNAALEEMQDEMEKLKAILENQKSYMNHIPETDQSGEVSNKEDLKYIIKKEIDAYDADKIAQVDYALETAGGRILSILTTKPYVTDQSFLTKVWDFLTLTICKDGNADTARPILQPRMAPGECWAFEGSKGEVIIKLLAKIHVRGITIEHIPAAISPSAGITSAPKVFNLWGLKCRDDPDAFLFGEFTYINDSTPIQYFDVQHESYAPYEIVLLKILSNWGNQQYTCVYRVRIHGELY